MPGDGASLADVLLRTTLAARPAASAVATGTLHSATDYPGRSIEQSDGSAWNRFGPFGTAEERAALTAPVSGDFAWVNQGGSSVRDDTDSFVLIGAATGAGTNLVLRVKTAPATPYVITAYLLPLLVSKAFNSYGLAFRQTGTGEIATLQVGAVSTGTQLIEAVKFNSPTSFNASYFATVGAAAPLRWFRIADDGVNRIVSISADGVDWLQLHSIGRTDFLTADQVGVFIGTENSATPNLAPIVRVLSWVES